MSITVVLLGLNGTDVQQRLLSFQSDKLKAGFEIVCDP